jgi:hypothetical protein
MKKVLTILMLIIVGAILLCSCSKDTATAPVPTYGISLSAPETYVFQESRPGYGEIAPLEVIITNTGNQPIALLNMILSGDNANSFTLSQSVLTNLNGGASVPFNVKPNTRLTVNTYTATVTVTDNSYANAQFNVSFTVTNTPAYSISLSQNGTYTFSNRAPTYSLLAPLQVNVTNDGAQPPGQLSVALSGTNADSYYINTATLVSLDPSESTPFTVRPNNSLPIGTYTATVTVSGSNNISVGFDVSFTVAEIATEVGDLINFGGRRWRVLDIQNGQALVVSERVVEYRAYHTSYTSITWAECSLRSYLNGEWLFKNFKEEEDRARIVLKTVINSDNPLYRAPGGVDTQDYVFLLSIDEVLNYLYVPDKPKSVIGSDYFISDDNNSARVALDDKGNAAWWWLRSPGYDSNDVSDVSSGGYLYLSGYAIILSDEGVRPALWLDL